MGNGNRKVQLLNSVMKYAPNIISRIQGRPFLFKLFFQYHLLFGKSIIPPSELNFVGDPNFEKIGRKYLEYIKNFTNLSPEHSVLDIGCGIGRIAAPMTEYLNQHGRYEGFDIVDLGVQWCRKKITKRYPNFKFQQSNIYNQHYNPTGIVVAEEFRFPYEDNSFDVAYATSVFTHMMPGAVQNYLNEIFRVLKPKGRSLCTFFILDDSSKANMATGRFPFKPVENHNYWVMHHNDPENAIAYDIDDIKTMYSKANLSVIEPVRFGSWSGRKNPPVGGQDMMVCEKLATKAIA